MFRQYEGKVLGVECRAQDREGAEAASRGLAVGKLSLRLRGRTEEQPGNRRLVTRPFTQPAANTAPDHYSWLAATISSIGSDAENRRIGAVCSLGSSDSS